MAFAARLGRHRVIAGHRLAALGLDLVHHRRRRSLCGALPIGGAAEVVDHHLGAKRRPSSRA